MKRFIRELRRREVFRTAGLYVGICWIVIEVGSVILPAVDAPEWIFRGAIFAAFAGFPVMLVLAWFFDVNEEGISLQADPADTAVEQLGARKTDFVIIGVLVLALIVSVFLNVKGEPTIAVAVEPIPVLVADFERPADSPLFEHVLEEVLIVGLEVAPHIVVVNRELLDGESAREVARREGIKWLVTGSLQPSGDGYRITIDVIDVADGGEAFSIDEKAGSQADVLQAMATLSGVARKKLGGKSRDGEQTLAFTAASLEAAHAYASARQLERAGELEAAIALYEQAIVEDPDLGRAFSQLALAEFALGRRDQGEAHWSQALSLSDTMTARERLRVLGRYQASVAMDYDKAAATYAELIDKYPADVDARQRYAAVSALQGNFEKAVEQTRKIIEMLPADNGSRTRLALYAMYAGDWEAANSQAAKVIAADPQYGIAYLPGAIAALVQGQADAARAAYERMASANDTGYDSSVAALGLADIDLYFGQFGAAQARLKIGMDADIERGMPRMAALKSVALAQSYIDQGDNAAATSVAANALQLADDNALTVPAAMIYISANQLGPATAIAESLAAQTGPHSRAYGQMLKGMLLERQGEKTGAIIAMRDAISTADLWLIRMQIGQAYLRAGNYTEALDELLSLKARRGEAASVFLDDMPTYRLLAELPYWTGRVQEQLNMQPAARKSYDEFIALRPQGGALAEDAIVRRAAIQ